MSLLATPAVSSGATALPGQDLATINLPTASALRPEFLIGGVLLVLGLAYVGLYWRGQAGADRYATGFILERCPICGEGHLHIERHQERVLGIPRVRATVRCDNCRSILREVGGGRWRYAVDPVANMVLFYRYNNHIITDSELVALAEDRLTPTAVPDDST